MTNLVLSARQWEPWAKALFEFGKRHGPTPIHDQLVAEFAAKPKKPAKKRDERGRFVS